MSQQRQPSGTPSELDRSDIPRRFDGRGPARAPGRSAASVVAVSVGGFTLGTLALGALGIGAMHVSPARTTAALEGLAGAWTHLLPATRPGAEPRHTAVAFQPRSRAEPAPVAAAAPSGQGAIAYGDRLKVTFFESVAVSLGDPAQGPDAPAPVTIFPRMDLSGEYVVDEAGGLDIPRLGWRAVAGRDVAALEAALAGAFQRAFGRPGDVHVATLDRRPVYVLGGPRGGATIKYAPGLIVLQALAEAGGRQRDVLDTSRAIEAIRETQRLGEAQDRLARALVRQARLIALRDGLAAVTLPPATAVLLAETIPQDAAAWVREADVMLALEQRAHTDRLALADRQVEIANQELVAQNMRLAQAGVVAQSKARRLRDLEGIAARGSVAQFKLVDATVEVAEADAKQADLRAAVAQAQSRLTEAEIARAKLAQAHTSQITLDLEAVAREVGDLRRAVASMRAVVTVLGEGQDAPPGAKPGAKSAPPESHIVRRGPGGTFLIPAADTTPLMPGDVLQIGPSAGPARPDTADPRF